MKVQSEEVFGPVVSLQRYESLDDAIDWSNGTRYGLQAGIYTMDLDDGCVRTPRTREFGGVLVNEVPIWRPT